MKEKDMSPDFKELTAEQIDSACDSFAKIWTHGYRHQICLISAGVLFNQKVSLQSALQIMPKVLAKLGVPVEQKLKDVTLVYQQGQKGNPIAGVKHLERMIDQEFPENMRDEASRELNNIKKAF